MTEVFAIASLGVFVLGTLIGSFLNVVILRLHTGRSVSGRSFCYSCGKTLKAIELVPILSFLVLRGKCGNCKSPISWQYPAVEFITGLIFFLTFLKISEGFLVFNLLELIVYLFVFSLLIVISVYDIRHTIIPDGLSYLFSGTSLAILLFSNNFASSTFLSLDFFAGPILFLPFFVLWYVSDGRWMGLGDGKLALGVGWLLGFVNGVSAIIIGFWSGALISVLLIALNSTKKFKKIGLKTEIPFAPFIIFGVFLSFIFNLDILNLRLIIDLIV